MTPRAPKTLQNGPQRPNRTQNGSLDPQALREAHRAAVGRWARHIIDYDGRVPEGLLDELAAIAAGRGRTDGQRAAEA